MLESVVLERFPAGKRQPGKSLQKRQRVYIFPTRQGFIFAVMLITMLLGAINYSNSMAFLLTFLLGSLFLVNIVHTYRNLAGLIINSHSPESVFAGNLARFPFSIDNRNGHEHLAVEIQHYPRQKHLWQKRPDVPVTQVNVPARHIEQLHVMRQATVRGLLPIGRVRIATRFPLGLCCAWSYFDSGQQCVVYPAPVGTDQLPPGQPTQDQDLEGDKSGTDDFTGFRYYRPGDSIRSIAWKKLAHDDQLLVKRFSGSGGNRLWLHWEDTMQHETVELRLSQLCLWILRADQHGFQYGLELPGVAFEPGTGSDHQRRCLEALALYRHA